MMTMYSEDQQLDLQNNGSVHFEVWLHCGKSTVRRKTRQQSSAHLVLCMFSIVLQLLQ